MVEILRFRKLRNGEPQKLKVLAEDLRRTPWLARLSVSRFGLLVTIVAIVVFLSVAVAGSLL